MPLLAISETYLPHKGGHVIWLHELCKRMPGARVITGRQNGCPAEDVIDSVTVRRVLLKRYPFLRPESLVLYGNLGLQALREAVSHRPEAVLGSRVLPEGLVAHVVGEIARIRSIVLAHGEEIRTWTRPADRRRLTGTVKARLLWQVYKAADHVVANSRFTRELLLDGGVRPEKVALVHPGTDPQRFRPRPADPGLVRKWNLEDKRVLLTIGRLSRRKGQDTVLRALPAIRKDFPEAVYVIGGVGVEEERLRGLAASLDVQDHVRFLGEIEDATLPSIYNLADIFIMPNRRLEGNDVEGFGIVFLEASASGLPVIGGRSGGVPDAVADNKTGMLVDGSDLESVIAAVTELLKHPDAARELGRAGRQRVCNELTWDHSAERLRALIRS